MNLKIEVEEIHLLDAGGYLAIVRANRYEKSKKAIKLGSEVLSVDQEEKTETPAEFRITVSWIARRARKTERPIEDIKRDAKAAVLELCREITSRLEQKPKTQN